MGGKRIVTGSKLMVKNPQRKEKAISKTLRSQQASH